MQLSPLHDTCHTQVEEALPEEEEILQLEEMIQKAPVFYRIERMTARPRGEK